jgi:hypothetical protein
MASTRNLRLVQSWLFTTSGNPTVHFHSNYYVISLYHDTVGGSRYVRVNFEDVPDSYGSSSAMMGSAIHRINFVIDDRPGYLEIKRSGGFAYKCVVDNVMVPEAHRRFRASERQLYTASISSSQNAPSDEDPSGRTMVTWYAIESRRHDDIAGVAFR